MTPQVHLQSNTGDHEVMVWAVATGRPVRDMDTIRDLVWAPATQSCTVQVGGTANILVIYSTNIFQWSSLGTWGESGETADPSALAPSNGLLGVGDTWGRVRLYSSPACQPRSLCHTYTGHSSQVKILRAAHQM